jgi:hypothetical protein
MPYPPGTRLDGYSLATSRKECVQVGIDQEMGDFCRSLGLHPRMGTFTLNGQS